MLTLLLRIDFPPPPHLLYKYPPPNQTILNNIRNALLSVPVFYTQVLHLMNKMNLPPPFDRDGPTVPLDAELRRKRKRSQVSLSSSSSVQGIPPDSSSSSSELESDSEEERRKLKKQKLQEIVNQVKDRTRIQITHDIIPIFGPGGSVNLTKGPPIISVTPKKVKGKTNQNNQYHYPHPPSPSHLHLYLYLFLFLFSVLFTNLPFTN